MKIKLMTAVRAPVAALLVISLVVGLQACAQVKPWERGDLARSEMAWDPDPLASTLDAHIYFAKEASSGGSAAEGGGCGCN
ncbi:DUF4266 domain-containing protein [Allohahella marinimesophila]|uniref:DUF4266 domain-containing protein n=1 Tax=Allohahella marinimesophila TaxID=1054972 RepID=A0ABP7PBN9_9GAMM